MYAYKDRLADGFDKGLENGMLTNIIDDPQRNVEFNWMQRNVNFILFKRFIRLIWSALYNFSLELLHPPPSVDSIYSKCFYWIFFCRLFFLKKVEMLRKSWLWRLEQIAETDANTKILLQITQLWRSRWNSNLPRGKEFRLRSELFAILIRFFRYFVSIRCDSFNFRLWFQGCYDKVSELIDSNMSMIVAAAIFVSIFPVVGVLLTYSMASNLTKTKYEQMA